MIDFAIGVLHYDWERALDTPMPMIEAGRRGFYGAANTILTAVFGKKKRRRNAPPEPGESRSLNNRPAFLDFVKRHNKRFAKPPRKPSKKQQEAVDADG